MTTLVAPSHEHTAPAAERDVRKDIQALRAIAVAAVVVYHLWPAALPGGFVGVDVFFVISGFLITSQLVGRPPSRPADLARFWGRRVLRLIPAVALVILATLGGALLFMSVSQWDRVAGDALSSMLYVENWRLISDATDYLDQNRAPSPFQHYWSLSVEEQYYLLWPLVTGLLAWLTRRHSRRARTIAFGAGFGALVLTSLVLSLTLTSSDPARAYFATYTRLWQLGVGSLLAVACPVLIPRLGAAVRAALLWAGVLALVVALVVIDDQTAYPGVAALLPTLAAAALIVASDPEHRLNPRRLHHSRAVQHVGDTSYAIYLWHWPLIILAPFALDRSPGPVAKLVIVALTLGLATASTYLVENPLRNHPALRNRTRRSFLLGLALTVLVVAASFGLKWHVDAVVRDNKLAVRQAISKGDPCLGAGALTAGKKCPADPELVTDPAFAKDDISPGIAPHWCLNWPPFDERLGHCQVGDTKHPQHHVAIFGNSHMGEWLPTFKELGRNRHWQVDTYLIGACATILRPVGVAPGTETTPEECVQILQDEITLMAQGGYDLIVVSAFTQGAPVSAPNFDTTVAALAATGVPVVVIRSTPTPLEGEEVADCVARHLDDSTECDGQAAAWILPDPLDEEVRALADPRVQAVDMNEYFCPDGTTCPSVIGGVIVYRDNVHMTATYARTLAPMLAAHLVPIVRGDDG